MRKITLLFSFLFIVLVGVMAGSGTEADPYSCAEIIAGGNNVASGTYAVGYIVGGRYDDFDYNSNEYAISIADSEDEDNVNNCVQVKLSTSQRPNWHPKNNPSILGSFVIVSGSGNGYGGYPAFENSVTIALSNPPVVAGVPVISNALPIDGTVYQINSIAKISAIVTTTDAEGIDSVKFAYGETEDMGDTIPMIAAGVQDSFYISIPLDVAGALYGQVVAYGGNDSVATSSKNRIIIVAPETTTLPYEETFDTDFGQCFAFSVSGDNKEWLVSGGEANMNGYNTGDLEEDWLILPGVDFDAYKDENLTFTTSYQYGTDDVDNYLKLVYSTDFSGMGDPSTANWTELTTTTFSDSENIDLSAIVGDNVYLAFKYHYNSGSYRSWDVDNIVISGADTSSVAPVFEAILPGRDTTITLGDTLFLQASVSIPSGSVDSVITSLGVASVPMVYIEESSIWYLPIPVDKSEQYSYQLTAYGNNESVVSDVYTLSGVCAEVEAPVASAASDITNASFTANWNAVEPADHYLLSAWKGGDAVDLVLNGGFEDGDIDWTKFESEYEIVGAEETTPHSGNSCLKCFATATRDLAQDITFTADGVSQYEISYWYKYSDENDPQKLRIYSTFSTGSSSGDNLTPSTYNSAVAEWTEMSYIITPSAGENTLHLELRTYSTGKAYIDDISMIKVGGDKTYIIQDSIVDSANELPVVGLEQNTDYYYNVIAVNKFGCKSEASNITSVTTGVATSVDKVKNAAKVFASDDCVNISTTENKLVTIYEVTGRQVANQNVDGKAQISLKEGIYLVKVDQAVTKVVVW